MDFEERTGTMKKVDEGFVGETFETKNYGPIRVLRRSERRVKRAAVYEVEFVNTSYRTEAIKSNINKGYVKDKSIPSLHGVGYLGDTSSVNEDGSTKREYHHWANMLYRCYDEKFPRYNQYGGRGIRVCERWHGFENFEQDIRNLEGYDDPAKEFITRRDMDGNYEPSNCQWSKLKTQIPKPKNLKDFVAISPGGEEFEANNQTEFAKQHNLTRPSISACLGGRQKTHKGWTFRYKENARS